MALKEYQEKKERTFWRFHSPPGASHIKLSTVAVQVHDVSKQVNEEFKEERCENVLSCAYSPLDLELVVSVSVTQNIT